MSKEDCLASMNCDLVQGHRNRSSWSDFGCTTISQGKNKIPFYKKQVPYGGKLWRGEMLANWANRL